MHYYVHVIFMHSACVHVHVHVLAHVCVAVHVTCVLTVYVAIHVNWHSGISQAAAIISVNRRQGVKKYISCSVILTCENFIKNSRYFYSLLIPFCPVPGLHVVPDSAFISAAASALPLAYFAVDGHILQLMGIFCSWWAYFAVDGRILQLMGVFCSCMMGVFCNWWAYFPVDGRIFQLMGVFCSWWVYFAVDVHILQIQYLK